MITPTRSLVCLLSLLVLAIGGPAASEVKPYLVETGILEMTKSTTNPAVSIEIEEKIYFKDNSLAAKLREGAYLEAEDTCFVQRFIRV